MCNLSSHIGHAAVEIDIAQVICALDHITFEVIIGWLAKSSLSKVACPELVYLQEVDLSLCAAA